MTGAQPGQVIDGRFELLQRLGHGGMGTVWRARDTTLHREVALKEVRPSDPAERGGDAERVQRERVLRERVLREARALARLSHPNVVRIYHIVDIDPHPWLVMELLPGESLESRAARGPLPPAEAARYGRHILAALTAAHAEGIHHRDVKPANVLLRADGSAVLTDFGIAAIAGSSALTVTGGIVGSPEYIAPERVRGAGDHPSADLWSLGITLYVLTEGYSPLRRGTTLATLSAVLEDPVPPPVRSGPLGDVLRALLVKDPAARPDAARLDAMLAAVERGGDLGMAHSPTETGVRPTATTGPITAPPRPGAPRTRVIMAAAAALLLIGAGALTASLLRGGGDRFDQGGEGEGNESPSVEETPREDLTPPTPDPVPEPEPEPDEDEDEETDQETEEERIEEEGRWVAQLFSESVDSGTAARDERLDAVRATVPEAEVLLSADWASLRPGYWFIYAPGPFADGNAALAFCAERGLTTGNECVGRYLSHDPADADLLCNPDNLATSRCDD
ncbi:serine/threonine-protein kinase [Streptomyces radicis]|uniref:non-specific serine/threonine protein kinase n=1 Tax=Streptomyces radicis TaxID=1750517 RepID=A0A3A9W009_9ACTN|nr:serine/threonine-protein kinase [Streptomyces radicis]RKN06092.1 serine/threonine protein kinase [Streptomyces radicis]RKN18461.1 serine/threonine protein kinase [Streptomyces radicis]